MIQSTKSRKLLRILAATFLGSVMVSFVFVLFTEIESHLDLALAPPSLQFWFGTDSLGRDLFWRVIFGAGFSLLVGLAGAIIAACLGIVIGLVSGTSRREVDLVIMRIVDTIDSLPDVLLAAVFAISLALVLGEGLFTLMLAMGLSHWMAMSRQARALAIRENAKLYVLAATTLGGSRRWIILRHILPNLSSHLWTVVYFTIPNFIVFEATLSFLGLGLKPPHTSLGALLNEGWRMLSVNPMLAIGPAMMMMLILLSLQNLLTVRPDRRRLSR